MMSCCAATLKLVAYHRSNESNKELGMHSLGLLMDRAALSTFD